MNNSIWLEHPKYPGYKFSPEGNCLSIKLTKYGRAKILKNTKNGDGYPTIKMYIDGKKITQCVHRVIAEIFIKKPNSKIELQTNHRNGIKTDNRIENLEWVTHRENMQHSFYTLGRNMAKGETHGNSKLTLKKVIKIKKMIAKGIQHKEIAKKFGVCKSNISYIKLGKSWGHVKVGE